MRVAASLFAAPLLFMASLAAAQMPSLGGLGGASGGASSMMGGLGGGGGGASSMMGGLTPNVSSMGAGNAAGVIGYCMRNKYLGEGSAAGSVMSKLQGGDTAKSPDYSAGQGGMMQLGSGKTLSMDSLPGPMKSKVCDMVLTHAKSMI